MATRFVDDLAVPTGARWLDVGCGTGDLLGVVTERCAPEHVVGVDPSEAFLAVAASRWPDVDLRVGAAEDLPLGDATVHAAVSGLALNFVPNPVRAFAEMARVTAAGGVVAAYVWDYAHPDFFLTRFWDAATRTVLQGRPTGDERGRWELCTPDGLAAAARAAGLDPVVSAVEVETVFADRDELWSGFELGVGPSGALVRDLDEDARATLRATMESGLPYRDDGTVRLPARAWRVVAPTPLRP